MSEQASGGGKAAPKPHVKHHLEKRGVDHADVPDDVLVVLNGLSEDELKALRRVGASMEDAGMDPPLRAAMVH
jgi:hypothetical protein